MIEEKRREENRREEKRRAEKRREEKIREEKESEKRRCRRAKKFKSRDSLYFPMICGSGGAKNCRPLWHESHMEV